MKLKTLCTSSECEHRSICGRHKDNYCRDVFERNDFTDFKQSCIDSNLANFRSKEDDPNDYDDLRI